MPVQVYSTLSRRKEPFPKAPGDTVTMYVCGPTVYKPSHIGHMVGPVIFDTIKRYLTFRGYKVKWVVNITDVDDKLIQRASQLGTTVPQLAQEMTLDYFNCLKQLNVTGIDHFPRATEYIPQMIALIDRLIAKGYAYPVDGDVYFDVSRDEDYGKLCNRDPEQLEAGARIEVSDRKRNPGDFALWKGAKPGEPPEVQFDSPWGKGRPGWHIECSAMATTLLGETIDIHGGGLDLQFPHHENELAQSESATGKTFARIWMHNGLLRMGTAKMAGSVGNVVNIADLLQRHTPETVRVLLLSTHYRSPIEYNEDRLNEIARSLEGFHRFFERYQRLTGQSFYDLPSLKPGEEAPPASPDPDLQAILLHWQRFQQALDDDFNTAAAIGCVHESLAALNRIADRIEKGSAEPKTLPQATLYLRTMASILGLFWQPPPTTPLTPDDAVLAGLMQLLIDVRNHLRQLAKTADKDNPLKKPLFEQSDLIRQRLGDLGLTLEDRPTGTTWRRS